jgi:hypothetical protein
MKNRLEEFQAQHKKYKRKSVQTVTNGCGGKKGTKCGVELYIMPHDSKVQSVK